MRTDERGRYSHAGFSKYGRLNTIITAVVFISVGLLWLARNFGYIDANVFHVWVSWQMLLIVIGMANLLKRHFIGGCVTIGIGVFFLLPEITGVTYWKEAVWPLVLILIGMVILFKRKRNGADNAWHKERNWESARQEYLSENGFLVSENTFSAVEQIVLDPVFRGGRIKCLFGSMVLDLRRTTLESPETYIDVDCMFSGIEIFTPAGWYIQTQLQAIFGGSEDKRYRITTLTDREHVLIIRGKVTFGGIEFKN